MASLDELLNENAAARPTRPSNALVKNLQFATNTGAIEQFTGMYRVHVVDGSKPVGTFQIELFNAAELAVVIFDIVSLPSDPGIRVFASADGITQVEASAISRSGYRVNAWFPNMAVKYLKIEISPTHPDTIGGNTFTFGLTSFSAEAVDYALFSELVTKPVVFKPQTVQGRFRAADSGADVGYYLSMTAGADSVNVHVADGDLVTFPGAEQIDIDLAINASWGLCPAGSQDPYGLPTDVVPGRPV